VKPEKVYQRSSLDVLIKAALVGTKSKFGLLCLGKQQVYFESQILVLEIL
jgi:hypothetical protein